MISIIGKKLQSLAGINTRDMNDAFIRETLGTISKRVEEGLNVAYGGYLPLFLLSLAIPLVLLIPHNVFAWHALTAACNNARWMDVIWLISEGNMV
ncbi:MAG: hypothetical protein WAK17_09930 [Candidatus Nitrosopolaris sp.]